MKSLSFFIVILSFLLLSFGAAGATTYNYTVTPDMTGSNFPVSVPGDYPTSWGASSWKANGEEYTKLYMTPENIFGNSITIADLSSVTYWTKKSTLHSEDAGDWFFQIYTKPYDGSPGSSWYGNRINAEPYFSKNLNAPAGQWNQWQTGAGDNQLRFFDSSTGYFGSYTDDVWADFKTSFASHEILYLVIGTGTPWGENFFGQLDGLSMTAGQDTVNINFEGAAVPVPAAVWLLGSGLLGLLGIRRKIKN